MSTATRLSVEQLLTRAAVLGVVVRPDVGRAGVVLDLPPRYGHVADLSDVDLEWELVEVLRRESEVHAYLTRLRAPVTAGEVPAASPAGDPSGAQPSGAPVLHGSVVPSPLVKGGQGRTERDLVEDLRAFGVVALVVAVLALFAWGPWEILR